MITPTRTVVRSEVYLGGGFALVTPYFPAVALGSSHPSSPPLRLTAVAHDWWPLAASWALMGLEMPAISIVVGHLPQPELMLAAFAGIAFPLALLVEAPIIMMLAASTALSRDLATFYALQRFMTILSLSLTGIHAIIAFTPVWSLAVVPLLDIPPEVDGAAREGFAWLLPWTWAIADRRFRQGMLIHFGRREVVAFGTALRLVTTVGVLTLLFQFEVAGVVVATVALSTGVIIEAGYVRLRSLPVVRGALSQASARPIRLTLRQLLAFYIPLAMTPVLVLAAQPLATAGITRMPEAIPSLAVWGPLGGIVFLSRSVGIAFNEVSIRLAARPGSRRVLRQFAWGMGLLFSAVLAVIALSPVGTLWFQEVVDLDQPLVDLGVATLWIAIPIPLLTFLQSMYQGLLVDAHRTRPITESVAIYLAITVAGLLTGILVGEIAGLKVAMGTYVIANIAQAGWLFVRCRDLISE